jgi:hypothetical protein
MHHPVPLVNKILEGLWSTKAAEIARAGGIYHAQMAQRPGNKRFVDNGPQAHYAVKPLLNQIDAAIAA